MLGLLRARILTLRGQAATGRRFARLARVDGPRGRSARVRRHRPRSGRSCARCARERTKPRTALLAEVLATPGAREIQYYGIYEPSDGPHRLGARRSGARRTPCGRLRVRALPLHRPRRRHGRTPRSPRPAATIRPPYTAMPRPLNAGNGSGSSPSRQLRLYSARAAVLHRARGTLRSHARTAAKPTRSSPGSRQRPHLVRDGHPSSQRAAALQRVRGQTPSARA